MKADGAAGDTRLQMRRTFDATPERVFDALTQPDQMARWFGPGFDVDKAVSDLTPGGPWSVTMRAPDGEVHRVGGAYLEIDPPRFVSFTWAWHSTPERVSRVSYRLSRDDAGQTVLMLTHDRFFDSAARDRHIGGWTPTLDRLVAYLDGPGVATAG